MKRLLELFKVTWPGFLVALLLALFANFVHLSTRLANFFIDPLYLAFILGLWVRWTLGEKFILWPGFALTQDLFIPIGIILYGTQVHWENLSTSTLQPFLIPLVLALILYYVILVTPAKKLKISKEGSLLIWASCGLLGPLAVVLLASTLEASDEDISFSMILAFFVTTIMLILSPMLQAHFPVDPLTLGTLSTLSLPFLSPFNPITQGVPGAIAAAGLLFGLKVAMLAPVAFGIYLGHRFRKGHSGGFPLFLILTFFAVSILFSFVPSLSFARDNYEPVTKFILTLALTGVGLSTNLRTLFADRMKAVFFYFVLALIASVTVYFTGLLTLHFLHTN